MNRKILHVVVILAMLTGSLKGLAQSGEEINRGQVIDTIYCHDNDQQSYSLYLPTQYDARMRWPVIYIFEPGARGSLPVKLYRDAAERYGYIVVASNNSKNGSWDIVKNAAVAMLDDTHHRFSIDTTRMYTSGFSGGSRAATAIAVLSGDIAGVIGCGAGFSAVPQYQPKPGTDLVYVGVVGRKDMNFLEHHDVRDRLDQMKIPNHLLLFEGKHQWPDSTLLLQSIEWLQLKAMQAGKIKADKSWILRQYRKRFAMVNVVSSPSVPIEKVRLYQQLLDDFGNILPLEFLNDSISSIKATQDYAKDIKKFNRYRQEEVDYREKYLQALTAINYGALAKTEEDYNLDWWETEIRHLQKRTRSNDELKANTGHRVLNMIWANCAETSFGLVSQQKYDIAISYVTVWNMIEPESVWATWYMAKVQALKGDEDQAFKFLEKAINNGLKNQQLLDNDPAFKKLKNDKRYQKITQKLGATAQLNR